MTRPISAELQAHIAQETTNLAVLWRITRTDGIIITYTDHNEDIIYLTETFKTTNSFAPTSISSKDDLSTDNLDVIGILEFNSTDNDIAEPDLAAGLYDFAQVEIMTINYEDVSQGTILFLKGWLGRVTVQGGQFTAEIRSLAQKLQNNIGRVYTAACDAILGDTRCGVSLGSFTFAATVATTTDNTTLTATALTQAAAYFTGGQITFTSGLNNGLSMEVKDFLETEVTLALPMPNTIAINDTFNIIAGCDKLKATCIAKFSNIANFRGFPDIPGSDKILETAGTFSAGSDG